MTVELTVCNCHGGPTCCVFWGTPQPTPWTWFSPGWRCPGCGRCHAPAMTTCPYCKPTSAPTGEDIDPARKEL